MHAKWGPARFEEDLGLINGDFFCLAWPWVHFTRHVVLFDKRHVDSMNSIEFHVSGEFSFELFLSRERRCSVDYKIFTATYIEARELYRF